MTNAIDPEPSSPALPRWRFRFGLKALFVITTILCVWLGYTVARNRQAAEMVDRHNAVLDAIIKNTVPPPNGTFYRLNPGSQDELNRRLGRTWPGDRFQRRAILSAGATSSIMSQELLLDVSALVNTDTRPNIARNLANHYSNQLQQLGLQRRSTTGGQTGGGNSTANVIWTTPKNELTVVIDSNVDADEPAAEVRIILIDSQQLHIW